MGDDTNTAPDSTRMTALKNLSNQLPVANSNVAAGQQAAQQMQLQQAIQKAGPATQTTAAAQDTGAAMAQQTGANQIQNTQNALAQNQQIGQLGLAQQSQQNQSDVASLQLGSQQQQLSNEQRLANLSLSTKQQLYDANIKFRTDQNGVTLFNEAQLADYATMKAQNANELQAYAQQADNLNQKNIQAMTQAYNVYTQKLEQQAALAIQQNDQNAAKVIAQKKEQADLALQAAKNKAANSAAMWSAGGTIVGGAVGAFGGPMGAAVGAGVGAGVGQMLGASVGNK